MANVEAAILSPLYGERMAPFGKLRGQEGGADIDTFARPLADQSQGHLLSKPTHRGYS